MQIEKPELSKENAAKKFTSNPKVMENYSLLQELGVFVYIDSLLRNLNHYKTLLTKGLDIFICTNIDKIIDATVEQISYGFLPGYIVFVWKPVQSQPEVTVRTYHNYKAVDLDIKVTDIALFEDFFKVIPRPVSFTDFKKSVNNDEAVEPFKEVQPEIVMPILGPYGLYGIIMIGKKADSDEYTGEEMEFLQQLMAFVSQAIKNHLHYEHSLRDVKTGLYNHGFFMDCLKEEIAQTTRYLYTSAVIVIDVDKFKNFNDVYGHIAGDQVLEKLSQVIRQSVRDNDVPSRFGGEEFTIILSHTEVDAAKMVAERLRVSVSEMSVPWEIPLPQVTISLGVFTFDQDSKLEPTEILRRADEALYISKYRGRNCSTVWEPSLVNDIPDNALRSY
ncbi:MAG: sensor domain-containing diguanylate cyclase [Treponema sp.]|nr:sensor domain-containing diguanylate cyclase [Treponema sp.]